ncbi:MAG: TRAP transporter fused permease subunit [Pseudooceanicola sp.]|nr:TRAP transporter fused permease subunit [Pseudooceanicola sp.]
MSDRLSAPPPGLRQRLVVILALAFIVMGAVNSMPAIPGWDEMLRGLLGNDKLPVRRFPTEWFYPLAFMLMMVIVALKHSMWVDWADRPTARRAFGLFMDLALVVAAAAVSLSYLVEIDSVCLIDRVTGARAEMIAATLKDQVEFAKLYGLPIPDTVEDPKCSATTGVWLVLIMGLSMLVFLGYNIKVWGLPLVIVALVVALYTFGTVLVWYFHGTEDISKYLVTKLGGEPRQFIDGRPNVKDALVNNASGILGQFLHVILNVVFPYIILGSLFGSSAGGQSLIKIAFLWTRNLRGGPAHAAIVSSALFGTITGGPVVNVLATGVLTIPMMLKRGFSKVFAGGIEAAASSGGSIMPPVMGVAAFILSALTAVPYRDIIIAAALPALAYFFCLFLSVVFQARKQGIEKVGEVTDDMRLTRSDYIHLLQIFLPIILILVLLLTPKDSIGCGPLGALFGAVTVVENGFCRATDLPWLMQLFQNAAGDAGAVGWWASALVIVLLFLDREVRVRPGKILEALSDSGTSISTLYLMFLAVTVIDVCLTFTGLSKTVAIDILGVLMALDLGGSGSPVAMFAALVVTMLLAVLLGMGMPAVPAYINVALLMGPLLVGLGIATFTAHMFIFYFAVASAITPPVALAAFAASTITRADPMATGFSAVRSGIVMFVIPFVFAFYPELLLIDPAIKDPSPTAAGGFLPGYDGNIHPGLLLLLTARLALALYLLASALARFDFARLPRWEVLLRLALAALVIAKAPEVYTPAILAALGWIAWRSRTGLRTQTT